MYKQREETITIVEETLELFPNKISVKPFLKWAGGKTQLLSELHRYVPKNYGKYIEPFIGGGAMFFSLNADKSVISDSNEELILTYKQIKSNVKAVIAILKTFEHSEKFYYDIRSMLPHELENDFRAARFIYLNKTCFNGLYRVNKKGVFNVPYGKGNGNFIHKKALIDAHKFLCKTTIVEADYLETLHQYAEPKDFVFLDPPYHPVGKYSDFKRYTKEFFYDNDQVSLKNEFDRLVKLGCHVVLTNSNHPFILDLYSDYEIKVVETKRMISSNAKTRNGKDIIVIGSND